MGATLATVVGCADEPSRSMITTRVVVVGKTEVAMVVEVAVLVGSSLSIVLLLGIPPFMLPFLPKRSSICSMFSSTISNVNILRCDLCGDDGTCGDGSFSFSSFSSSFFSSSTSFSFFPSPIACVF